jgi:hypothetical protein
MGVEKRGDLAPLLSTSPAQVVLRHLSFVDRRPKGSFVGRRPPVAPQCGHSSPNEAIRPSSFVLRLPTP